MASLQGWTKPFHFLFSITRCWLFMEWQEVNFFFFKVEQPIVGFEVHSLNNNKTNSLANPSYSVHICCVATESNVITLGYGGCHKHSPPCCPGTVHRILSDVPDSTACSHFPRCLYPFASSDCPWLLACFWFFPTPQVPSSCWVFLVPFVLQPLRISLFSARPRQLT